jgi:hypothetical protein
VPYKRNEWVYQGSFGCAPWRPVRLPTARYAVVEASLQKYNHMLSTDYTLLTTLCCCLRIPTRAQICLWILWSVQWTRLSCLSGLSSWNVFFCTLQVACIKFTYYFLLPMLDVILASSREPEVEGRLVSSIKTSQMLVRLVGAMLLTIQPVSQAEVLAPYCLLTDIWPDWCPSKCTALI